MNGARFKRLLAIFFLTFFIGIDASADSYRIIVHNYILDNGEKTCPGGTAKFTLDAEDLGHLRMLYFKDGKRYSISGNGAVKMPALLQMKELWPEAYSSELFMAIDIYIKILESSGEGANAKIIISKLLPVFTEHSSDYRLESEEIVVLLSPVDTTSILLSNNYLGKGIYVDFTLRKLELMSSSPGFEPEVENARLFEMDFEYSIYNQDAGQYELKDLKCKLGLGIGDESKGNCSFNKTFGLPENDSLYYKSIFRVLNPREISPDKIQFTLEVTHLYAINPEFDPITRELSSGKTTRILFEKEISISESGKTEIEILKEPDSPLPFDAKENLKIGYRIREP